MPGASRPAEFGTTTSGGPLSHRWRPPLGVSTTTVSGMVNRWRSASSRSAAEESVPDLVSRSTPIRWWAAGRRRCRSRWPRARRRTAPGCGGGRWRRRRPRARNGRTRRDRWGRSDRGRRDGGAQGGQLRPGQRDHRQSAFRGGQGMGQGQRGGLPIDGGHASMFVRMFEKGKRVRRGSRCGNVAKRVYRHFLTLERDRRAMGDLPGNRWATLKSRRRTSSEAVGQLPRKQPYFTYNPVIRPDRTEFWRKHMAIIRTARVLAARRWPAARRHSLRGRRLGGQRRVRGRRIERGSREHHRQWSRTRQQGKLVHHAAAERRSASVPRTGATPPR